MVGFSSEKRRAGYYVPAYLQEHGYQIIPVNPFEEEGLGVKAVDSLADVDKEIDLVLVFRKREAVPGVVDEAIAAGAKAIWMQSGIYDQAAADKAIEAGLQVVQDRCMMVEHRSWVRRG